MARIVDGRFLPATHLATMYFKNSEPLRGEVMKQSKIEVMNDESKRFNEYCVLAGKIVDNEQGASSKNKHPLSKLTKRAKGTYSAT
ncbi:hypothetical protein M8C21_006342, partial [Ambrosia artemisiifolia]